MMLDAWQFAVGRLANGLADRIVTLPMLRWTWTGTADTGYDSNLPEYRPSDRDAVRDMMAGRYLLASRLVETGGVSPFGIETEHVDWRINLQGFSWLRHFRDVRDAGERGFARMLVLDWIGRSGEFERETWAPGVCAQRVLNWLRHLNLLLEGANAEQSRTIMRSLGTQIQSLKVRCKLINDPVDRLLACIAVLGASLCDQETSDHIEAAALRLDAVLAAQIDSDGLHLARSPRVQLLLLAELASVRSGLSNFNSDWGHRLGNQVEKMHQALDALTLGSGEPVYANGTGQLPHDVLIAVQASGVPQKQVSRLLSGFGVLRDGEAVVIADGGQVPPPEFAREAHAGALSFEFSHGTEQIIGNCGPAPADLPDSKLLFRRGVAHSAPTINAQSATRIREKGPLAEIPHQTGAGPGLTLNSADQLLSLVQNGYAARFGVSLERRITLLSSGTTLVGQDRMIRAGKAPVSGVITARFHLAPGVMVRRIGNEGIVRLVLPNGAVWSFLWEGADLRVEESVRQSSYVGFHRTQQLVLEADVEVGDEIAWIVTLEQS
ncbi:heparinase II/III family protein [Devosia rhodophyticola]|uniref:Heparinase II/III family protein n=1 Tax=Devosia rhodophyticola TaxID=3026423 RepID=A0ABY7YTS3_9HYPH|nr:heparinase II/III family protein [Devosia rhodophyticola]WDR04435.1 heparinase II/III family protein [Devosia rhodophyticola]